VAGIAKVTTCILLVVLLSTAGCASNNKKKDVYIDPNMDFGAVQTVAIMPFVNLTRDNAAGERVRDIFLNKLLATGAVYVLPVGEVARGVAKMEMANPSMPSAEEIVKVGGILKVQAILSGAVREYGEVRAGTSSANVIAVSAQMTETQTGKVVWSASTSQGGITVTDRLFGGGGQAMEIVTEKAANDLINKLFK
jgi:polysaccharide biosynthesis protein PelC